MSEFWTKPEREAVEVVTEEVCTTLWRAMHGWDVLRAGRDWSAIQEWVQSKSDDHPFAQTYKDSIERHRSFVQYCVEMGFIAALELHFTGEKMTIREHIISMTSIVWKVLRGTPIREEDSDGLDRG